MNDIVWLMMRRMRLPLIVLVLVYFFSVLLMMLVPGVDDAGKLYHMNFLDAAYFIAILQTTIGFGEIPYSFTPAQRMLVYILLLPNVVAWLYSIGTVLGLILDKQVKSVFNRNHFHHQVKRLKQDFYIVCGFGNTGAMTVSGLIARGIQAVIIEQDETAAGRLLLDNEFAHVPVLTGQSDDRRVLEMAGLHHDCCKGVIATTNDDHANLTIAITAKLLRAELTVLARGENQRVCDNMASFGTDAIVDPYHIFSERFALATNSPVKYLVQDWLISVPGSELRKLTRPPAGHWIVCGAGRFGTRMLEQLQVNHMPYTVIDVHKDRLVHHENAILGRGTQAHTLRDAKISRAVGIIAGTGDDIDNLSIIMTARHLNPDLYVVARQERRQHDELFDASGAQLIARRSLIIARQLLSIVTTPLLQVFLQHMDHVDEAFAERTAHALDAVLENRSPNIWLLELKDELSQSLHFAQSRQSRVRLGHITHSSRSEQSERLPCVCLTLERGAQRLFLPEEDTELQINDKLLFAGRDLARRQMLWTLLDSHSLLGNITGKHLPRGALWRWMSERRH